MWFAASPFYDEIASCLLRKSVLLIQEQLLNHTHHCEPSEAISFTVRLYCVETVSLRVR